MSATRTTTMTDLVANRANGYYWKTVSSRIRLSILRYDPAALFCPT